jgi:hypothetical protein
MMPSYFKIGLLTCLLAYSTAAIAQLTPGAIAFVAYNTDGDDAFAWVALRRIPANTVIHFTDSSVSNGWFRWTEHLGDVVSAGPLSWVYTNTIPAGTVVRWTGGSPGAWSLGRASGARLNLSQDGDQLIAYEGVISRNTELPYPWQGDPGGATLLHALNFANNGWDNLTGGETETSFVPPGLSVNAGTAVHVSRMDNAYYDGVCGGSAPDLLAAIANPAHWKASNDVFAVMAWTGAEMFVVKPPGSVFAFR